MKNKANAIPTPSREDEKNMRLFIRDNYHLAHIQKALSSLEDIYDEATNARFKKFIGNTLDGLRDVAADLETIDDVIQ